MSLLYASLLAAAAAAQPPSPAAASPGCSGNLCGAEALRPFFARIEARQTAREGAPIPLHILQLGDSHTAGDMITQPLREGLQLQFGRGGRGVLPAGRPWPGYLTWGVTASQTGPWRLSSIFGRGYGTSGAGRPVGLSGYTQSVAAAGARLGVSSDDEANRFDLLTVCALRGPGAGTVTLRLGTRVQNWVLDAPAAKPECLTIDSQELVSAGSVTTEDARPVSITSIATFRKGDGIALSNLGVSGSQLVHQSRQDDRVAHNELVAYRPDLIVIAFGTNEGFVGRFDPARYEADLRAQMARVRRLAGREVPLLIVGAPDAGTRNMALANNYRSAQPCGNGRYVPGALGGVRETQRRVARDLGLAFWDWQAAMGGACSAVAWSGRGLVRGDLVHFTRAGGEEIGRGLFRDLAAAAAARADRPH